MKKLFFSKIKPASFRNKIVLLLTLSTVILINLSNRLNPHTFTAPFWILIELACYAYAAFYFSQPICYQLIKLDWFKKLVAAIFIPGLIPLTLCLYDALHKKSVIFYLIEPFLNLIVVGVVFIFLGLISHFVFVTICYLFNKIPRDKKS